MAEAQRPGAPNKALAYTLTVGGREITQADPTGLDFLSIEDHCDMIGVAEFTIEAGHEMSSVDVKLGADVQIELAGHDAVLFEGRVTELRHAMRQGRNTVTALAMDPMYQLAATRRVQTWEESTDSDIVRQVLGEHRGLGGQIDSTSQKHAYVLQRNESDLHFLRRLAARNGFLLMAREGKVDFVAPQYSGSPLAIPQDTLISLDYTISSRTVPQKLTVYGWDYRNKQRIEGQATDSDVERIGGGEVLGGGGDVGMSESYISDVLVTAQDGANQMARAEFNRLARNFLRGRAVIRGDARFRAGARVQFEGFAEGFRPDAFVVSSRHRVTPGSGYITEITFCSNARA